MELNHLLKGFRKAVIDTLTQPPLGNTDAIRNADFRAPKTLTKQSEQQVYKNFLNFIADKGGSYQIGSTRRKEIYYKDDTCTTIEIQNAQLSLPSGEKVTVEYCTGDAYYPTINSVRNQDGSGEIHKERFSSLEALAEGLGLAKASDIDFGTKKFRELADAYRDHKVRNAGIENALENDRLKRFHNRLHR